MKSSVKKISKTENCDKNKNPSAKIPEKSPQKPLDSSEKLPEEFLSKPTHRKTRSQQFPMSSFQLSTPSKSRFEYSYIPNSNIDILNCKAEITNLDRNTKKASLLEKKIMEDE